MNINSFENTISDFIKNFFSAYNEIQISSKLYDQGFIVDFSKDESPDISLNGILTELKYKFPSERQDDTYSIEKSIPNLIQFLLGQVDEAIEQGAKIIIQNVTDTEMGFIQGISNILKYKGNLKSVVDEAITRAKNGNIVQWILYSDKVNLSDSFCTLLEYNEELKFNLENKLVNRGTVEKVIDKLEFRE